MSTGYNIASALAVTCATEWPCASPAALLQPIHQKQHHWSDCTAQRSPSERVSFRSQPASCSPSRTARHRRGCRSPGRTTPRRPPCRGATPWRACGAARPPAAAAPPAAGPGGTAPAPCRLGPRVQVLKVIRASTGGISPASRRSRRPNGTSALRRGGQGLLGARWLQGWQHCLPCQQLGTE